MSIKLKDEEIYELLSGRKLPNQFRIKGITRNDFDSYYKIMSNDSNFKRIRSLINKLVFPTSLPSFIELDRYVLNFHSGNESTNSLDNRLEKLFNSLSFKDSDEKDVDVDFTVFKYFLLTISRKFVNYESLFSDFFFFEDIVLDVPKNYARKKNLFDVSIYKRRAKNLKFSVQIYLLNSLESGKSLCDVKEELSDIFSNSIVVDNQDNLTISDIMDVYQNYYWYVSNCSLHFNYAILAHVLKTYVLKFIHEHEFRVYQDTSYGKKNPIDIKWYKGFEFVEELTSKSFISLKSISKEEIHKLESELNIDLLNENKLIHEQNESLREEIESLRKENEDLKHKLGNISVLNNISLTDEQKLVFNDMLKDYLSSILNSLSFESIVSNTEALNISFKDESYKEIT